MTIPSQWDFVIKMEQSNNYAALEGKIAGWIASGARDFEGMAMEVFNFQRMACPEYGRFCDEAPFPGRWQQIPSVPVEAFRRVAIRSFPAEQTIRTFRTSGTTGEGYGEHHFCSLSLYLQAAVRGWLWAGLPVERVVALMPHPTETPHSSLSQMAAWLAPQRRFVFGDWERLEAMLSVSSPVVLFGSALAFLSVFEWMGARRIPLPEGSLAVETGGYKGSRKEIPKREFYRMFEERFGLPPDEVWNEYGMTELSSQFYARGPDGLHSGAPWTRFLVVDPATGEEVREGEMGVLQIFDAANLGSVGAIRTRDLAIRHGAEFELIGRDPAAMPRGCSRGAEEMLS